MPIASLLSRARVRHLDDVASADDALQAIAALSEVDGALEALRERELLGGTGIGHGVALPHGRLDALKEPRGVFLRLREPVDMGGQDADLLFALLIPSANPQLHLQALADIAAAFSDDGFRDAVRAANDEDALHALLAAGPT